MTLRLRPFDVSDEGACVAAHVILAAENFPFLLSYEPAMAWADWLARIERYRAGTRLPVGRVRSAFLVAEVDGEIVGRVSIRFALNDWLAREGGHIGYAVLPAFRRRGYATEMLRLALAIAKEEGVSPALLVCNDDNIASARVIERCGGVLEGRAIADDGRTIRRYWI